MSDAPSPVVSAMSAATQSLRDTAKWMVGGVVGTAAGVFAGSSLTSLGSLDPAADRGRLALALIGLLVGFGGLAIVVVWAFRVLTVETRTFREFVGNAEKEFEQARETLLERYKSWFPEGIASFKDYLSSVDAAHGRLKKGGNDDKDKALVAKAASDFAVFNANAGFTVVRNRFLSLRLALAVGTPIAIVGFGLFAWAVNPPPAKPRPPAFSLTIQGTR
ncbi:MULTISPECIES: hypothetical protein [unclassified Mesorhizobium]|uniref:hypothetical protein n=1 Tax=unclassified Mesorhizobium TaxID=325217 RepID=UPI00086AE19C|nr:MULTISPECIES: hypothetical protein [unclassified Mesorhizobium]MBN9257404.1 hypothetical protein [Mesorhizobium sp.]ODT19014.1 MAG: hypothetical protein ABS57_04735 [Mesorhizobium sp. SCN 65-12]OJX80492.1 MAG: hypothetical protein BGO93_00300 [Mesorhizobium sp. 65-26]